MKWVEIITLRSPGKIGGQLVDELLKSVRESDCADRCIKTTGGKTAVREFVARNQDGSKPCDLPGRKHDAVQ